MIDIEEAFRGPWNGVSFWSTTDGRTQCSLRRRGEGSAFHVCIGDTPEEAWEIAHGRMKVKPSRAQRRQRDMEDLL